MTQWRWTGIWFYFWSSLILCISIFHSELSCLQMVSWLHRPPQGRDFAARKGWKEFLPRPWEYHGAGKFRILRQSLKHRHYSRQNCFHGMYWSTSSSRGLIFFTIWFSKMISITMVVLFSACMIWTLHILAQSRASSIEPSHFDLISPPPYFCDITYS